MKNALILFYLRNFPFGWKKASLASKVNLSAYQSPLQFQSQTGVKFNLYLEQYIMRIIFLYGVSEKNTLRHVLPRIKKDMTIVDIGANIGTYTLNFAKQLQGTGRVIAFEPVSINANRLRDNIQLNGFNNITVCQEGISDQSGTATIYFGEKKSGASIINNQLPNKEEITITTLDEYCQQNNIAQIDVLKIDVEGAERKVLAGAQKIISASQNMFLIMECMEANQALTNSTTNDLYNEVIQMGFKAFYPTSWPKGLKEVGNTLPKGYNDNLIFIKQ